MRDETFFRQYRDSRNGNVTCWWGLRNDALSFLVIDETNGLNAHASFKLQAGSEGNLGILKCGDVERQLNGSHLVVHITPEDVTEAEIQLTSAQLRDYLEGGQFSLTLEGVKDYVRANAT